MCIGGADFLLLRSKIRPPVTEMSVWHGMRLAPAEYVCQKEAKSGIQMANPKFANSANALVYHKCNCQATLL